ncbi:RHS repeat-associated core domain-containing protein [Flavobacterium sp. I-SCBP12n]|uniref:RHS repeat-associated core domain-containing protein n=1 Tax=Flavobacterium pygoscelis TaxID=2893176 RepID=A0A9X1XSL9_9FLAO|nr:RHS repeat-associated core domain-containing protein [Flavobacterium pygoscelis]MCK8141816.1 RHS repeat-associated core domain-containing protein [Flavobacterium pygoscelis]
MGSTSYITTRNGSISQHVEYIAFGEILFEEHSSSFSSPYLFNGKELDRETNLSYYGARYLDMKTSLWLNVDPSKEKYPNIGSNVFCLNNPIIYTDPDGRDPIIGIIDAIASFALDVGMDYFGGMLIEGKSSQQSYDDIGWWSAGLNAAGAYAVATVTPTGTSTLAKIAKFAKSTEGKIVISVVSKMTTKALDKYSQGKYDDANHEFSFSKVSLLDLFWESAIETLVEQGFGSKADEVLASLKKENKKLYNKLEKQANKIAAGESKKRVSNYAKKVAEQKLKRNDAIETVLKTKTGEKVLHGSTSKKLNKETNPTQ